VEHTDNHTWCGRADVEGVLQELTAIRTDLVADLAMSQQRLDEVHANYRDSARNLLHYLALRRRDLRPLQLRLAALGLSSLGRAESHVLATVDAVLEALHRSAGRPWQPPSSEEGVITFADGQRLLMAHTDALLGPATPGRGVRIMVTMPTEAGDDYTLVHNLLKQGMDCMRINCAHDDEAAWGRMLEHLTEPSRRPVGGVACSWTWRGPSFALAHSSRVRASSRSGRLATRSGA
jgi:pyruvate kinase